MAKKNKPPSQRLMKGRSGIPPSLFAKFPAHTYIETGTGPGTSLQAAVDSGAFSQFYSVDIYDDERTQQAVRAHTNNPNVHIVLGEYSLQVLADFLEMTQDTTATIFLDAHAASNHGSKGGTPSIDSPVLNEIKEIIYGPRSDYTIIIDDMHFARKNHGWMPDKDAVKTVLNTGGYTDITIVDDIPALSPKRKFKTVWVATKP